MANNETGTLVVRENPEIEIRGTVENVAGCAAICAARMEDGELKFEWSSNGTEMFWDASVTMTRDGRTLFQDWDGREYTATELAIRLDDGTLVPCAETPGNPVTLGEGTDGLDWKMKALNAAEALKAAAAKFEYYETLHRTKGTPDGDEKAEHNRACAAMCRRAAELP